MMNEVTIILTPIDAIKYRQFLQNYDNISLLLDDKVFETKGAECILNFDDTGHIRKIITNKVIFHGR